MKLVNMGEAFNIDGQTGWQKVAPTGKSYIRFR
jgi:hypothetical protein